MNLLEWKISRVQTNKTEESSKTIYMEKVITKICPTKNVRYIKKMNPFPNITLYLYWNPPSPSPNKPGQRRLTFSSRPKDNVVVVEVGDLWGRILLQRLLAPCVWCLLHLHGLHTTPNATQVEWCYYIISLPHSYWHWFSEVIYWEKLETFHLHT